jgi:hypothetical protein
MAKQRRIQSMRPLAEFVMRGRIHALAVAAIATGTAFFYWFAAAIVALVTLRKGTKEGFLIFIWCSLPAATLWHYRDDIMPLACLPGAFIGAWALRSALSWSSALITTCLCGLVVAILLSSFGEGKMTEVVTQTQSFFASIEHELNQNSEQDSNKNNGDEAMTLLVPAEMITTDFVAGVFGVFTTFISTIALVLARWWQATLYNPGGFRQEFHLLRFSPVQAGVLFVLMLGLSQSASAYAVWAGIFAVPLLFSGIALVHGLVAQKQLSSHWLGLFYGLLVLVDPFKLVIAILAVLDSWFNFRGRLPQAPKDSNEP